MPFRALRFVEPEAAHALAVVPLIWICWALHRWYRNRERAASGIGWRRARLSPITGRWRDLTAVVLLTLASSAFVCAAARPQAVVSMPRYESFDLIVMLDRSASMLARDVQPSRVGRAALEVENFLRDRPEAIDRVGLVAFAGTPIVVSHLTRDLEIVSFFLDWMKGDPTPFYGTDLAAVLERAAHVAQTEAPKRRTVLVLLSDGEDHGEGLGRALQALRDRGTPVYVIGIGGEAAVTIPAPPGGDAPTLVDDEGHLLHAKFSDGTLQRIASTTGGEYVRSTDGAGLAKTLRRIERRERKPLPPLDEYHDVDYVPLAAAVVTLAGLLAIL